MEVFGSLLTYWRQQHPPHQTTNPSGEFKINTLPQLMKNSRVDKQAWVVKGYNRLYYLLIAENIIFLLTSFAFTSALAPIRSSANGKWPFIVATMSEVLNWKYQCGLRSQNSITRVEWLCTDYPLHYVDNQFEMGECNEEVKSYYTIFGWHSDLSCWGKCRSFK